MNKLPRTTRPDAPSAEELNRCLNDAVREYASFVTGFGALLDGVERWRAEATGEEAQRWELLRRQATSLLLQHGVRPTAVVGRPVDLRYHEVMATEPSADVPPDTVLRVLDMGLELTILGQAILLRRARVVVSRAPDGGQAGEGPAAPGGAAGGGQSP